MSSPSDVFEKHYAEYRARLEQLDFDRIAPVLGLLPRGENYSLLFFDRCFTISPSGIWDENRQPPDYATFVILAQYLSRCPAQVHHDTQWAAFKDLKRESHFTNLNYFASDTEQRIVTAFSGKLEALSQAAGCMGGAPGAMKLSYDLVLQFQALPRIGLLLLFNDGDEDFPAYGTVLFWQQAEYYLDPESLAMTSALLTKRLEKQLQAEAASRI
jgi:hypothetical protein